MLLRDDRQTALNRVESLSLESADGYASAAGRCADRALAALFEQAQRQRQELAAALAPHIRALGDLPRGTDPDRETVEHVVDNIRAYLAADSDATLLEQRLQADAGLEQAMRAALAEALPEETRTALKRALDMLDASCTRLLNLRH
jgi:uncharacterized protein (TIGR02284 family)